MNYESAEEAGTFQPGVHRSFETCCIFKIKKKRTSPIKRRKVGRRTIVFDNILVKFLMVALGVEKKKLPKELTEMFSRIQRDGEGTSCASSILGVAAREVILLYICCTFSFGLFPKSVVVVTPISLLLLF